MRHDRQDALMRVAFLLSFLGLSIGDSFNVLYSKQLAERLPNLTKPDFLTSLPITAMSGMMMIGVLFSGVIARRSKDYMKYMRTSLVAVLIGMLLRGLAFNYFMMLAGFMVDGFGYGCLFIGIRYYAFLFPEQERMGTLAFLNGGAFAGTCMGTILGGMLAGQLPYRTVYLLAAAILIVPLLFIRKVHVEQEVRVGKMSDILKVFKNPKAFLFLLLIVLPVYTCAVFISYTVPLDVNNFGYSATVISALLLGEYLISGYLGPFATKFVEKHVSPLIGTVIFCMMYAVSIGLYSLSRSMPMLIIVIIILGIADSFGLNIITAAFTGTKKDDSYDDNTALIAFILFSRLGMTVAPTLILFFGNVIILSVVVLGGLALFLVAGLLLYLMAVGGKRKDD
jgi:MFS family permease